MESTESRKPFGVRSMSSRLRRVLVRQPATSGDFASADWRIPDPELLSSQHDRFTTLLADLGCEVEVAPAVDGLVDSCYVRDPALISREGAILFDMAKPVRRAEPDELGKVFEQGGIPILGRLTGDADGGDMVWMGDDTLLVGRSYRTNGQGVRQLGEILAGEGVRVESVDVPHDRGPEHVLHLMSFLSPLAPDLAAVYLPLAPVRLVEMLRDGGIEIVAIDDDEYLTMACNILAVRPRVTVMVTGNPRTEAALKAHGCEVHTYDGSEISLKGDGGPTCLTAPLWRE